MPRVYPFIDQQLRLRDACRYFTGLRGRSRRTIEDFPTSEFEPAALPERAVAATLYLATFGSVLGFVLYYYMIKHMEAGHIALIALITPVMALLLGHILNHEEVLPHVWLGTAFILLGLCMHRWGLYGWRICRCGGNFESF